MQKIDKSQQLSTVYRDWENDLEQNNKPHPSYTSQGKYYKDIVMDALRCQGGLCAYTEVQLCPPQYLTEDNWKNGSYASKDKVNNGQLEHFDEKLKWKDKEGYQKKDWLWSNFFVVDSDTNNRKSDKEISYILKPDTDDYDPFRLFEYSKTTHLYVPNTDLPEEEQEEIRKMIEVLGLNFSNLVSKRKQIVERVLKLDIADERQFPTAMYFFKNY